MADLVPYGTDPNGRFRQAEAGDQIVDRAGTPLGGGGSGFGGSGSLGDVVISSNQNLSGVLEYDNLTINPAVIVTVPANSFLYIKCAGNFVNNGSIDAAGAGQTGASGISAGGLGGRGGDNSSPTIFPQDSFNGQMQAGTTWDGSGNADPSTGSLTTAWFEQLLVLPEYTGIFYSGAQGGNGGIGDATAGTNGLGGGMVVIDVVGSCQPGNINCNGTNGGNGGSNTSKNQTGGGGGGGGGGGLIVVRYFTGNFVAGGTRTVAGGTAGLGGAGDGAPDNGGNGAAGLDGQIFLVVMD